MNFESISKEISYALRHNPQEYGLELDKDGWVDLTQLLKSLRNDQRFLLLTEGDVIKMIELSEKKRHEIVNGKIRAVYGHSISKRIEQKPCTPPSILYHGTAKRFIENILREGLVSKSRQYVHLSEDIETALTVGKRRDALPAVLRINATQACNEGVTFYLANDKIWLADSIPAKYLEIV